MFFNLFCRIAPRIPARDVKAGHETFPAGKEGRPQFFYFLSSIIKRYGGKGSSELLNQKTEVKVAETHLIFSCPGSSIPTLGD